MLEILASPPHVGAYRFIGRLTGEDYDACIADLEARLQRFPRVAVVSDVADMESLTMEALSKDLRYAVSQWGEYGRFARVAVVTDKRWLVAVTELAAKFLPHSEVRTFAPEERAQALVWASALDPQASQDAARD